MWRKIERSSHTLKIALTRKMIVTRDVSPLRQTKISDEMRSHAIQRETKWRKCMGIEPTGATFIATPNGFENRGHHQVCKHFRRSQLLAYTKVASFAIH